MKKKYTIIILSLAISFIRCVSYSQSNSNVSNYLKDYNSFVSTKSIELSNFDNEAKDDLHYIIGETIIKSDYLQKLRLNCRSSNYLSLKADSLYVAFRKETFNQNSHRLTYDGRQLLYVDDEVKLGSLFDFPETVLKKIEVVLEGGKIISLLEESRIKNVFNPKFLGESPAVYLNKKLSNMYLFIEGGDDGKSYYSIVWVIKDNSLEGYIVYIP